MNVGLDLLAETGIAGPRSYVHHGSLAVDRSIDADFRKAETYLRRDPKMSRILSDLENSATITRIDGDSIGRDGYTVRQRLVDWDPHSAARFANGGRQSPALVLGHELAHADIDRKLQRRFDSMSDPTYDDGEERRVIVGAESHAARTLGESIRHNHDATLFRVSSPTSRT